MRDVNTVLLKLAKRAETYDRQHIIESFVDIGPLFTLLSNRDNQILFGRRGTGKTHVLGYLTNQIQAKGTVVVQLDMRTVGSTGGIYADQSLGIPARATRLLADTLGAIHEQILTAIIEKEECDLSGLAPNLDKFVEAASEVVVRGSVTREDVVAATHATTAISGIAIKMSAQPEAGVRFGTGRKDSTSQETTVGRSGTETFRVHFGAVGSVLQKLVLDLPNKELWVILDEWSEVPLDLQPYLADLLRRTLLPVRGVTLKIAAIEQRCNFRIADEAVGHIGIEIGADAAASINLDEFLVFENNPDLAKSFFRELLYRHVRAVVAVSGEEISLSDSSVVFINELFTQRNAFDEFVRAAEGVPRDAINIIGISAQRALDDPIAVPDVRMAARTWYLRAKQQAVQAKPEAQVLLNWIVDEVIQHRQARAFLLGADVKDDLIDFLYDARVLHVIRQGISGGDVPGRRFNVYALDYGCYVDLINTTRAPMGLFEAEIEGENGSAGFIEVPQTDFRSIRRAILDVDAFYAKLGEGQTTRGGTT